MRLATASDCTENTRKPPVNSATSDSTLRLTRYDCDSRAIRSAASSGAAARTSGPACSAAITSSWRAPAASRTSMRDNAPTRSKCVCAPAMSITSSGGPSAAMRPPIAKACAWPSTFSVTWSAGLPQQRAAAAGLTKTRSGSSFFGIGVDVRTGVDACAAVAGCTSQPGEIHGATSASSAQQARCVGLAIGAGERRRQLDDRARLRHAGRGRDAGVERVGQLAVARPHAEIGRAAGGVDGGVELGQRRRVDQLHGERERDAEADG